MAKNYNEEDRRKVLTFFLLFFPSLLIALIPSSINGSIWWPLVFKAFLLFYQFVALKNFIDTQYGE